MKCKTFSKCLKRKALPHFKNIFLPTILKYLFFYYEYHKIYNIYKKYGKCLNEPLCALPNIYVALDLKYFTTYLRNIYILVVWTPTNYLEFRYFFFKNRMKNILCLLLSPSFKRIIPFSFYYRLFSVIAVFA